ncbi:MAG: DUF1492 domain-containing protein [Candidatus Limiplasma sp.]|nr:DUF1492 domain-containing protein [Candidatus Limiplasma sp.]
MTAKEYFARIPRLASRINAKLDQLEYLKALATKTSAVLSDMPRSDAPNQQWLESTVVRIVDLGAELNRDIDRLIDLRAEALEAVRGLEDVDQQLVMELRYLTNRGWDEIVKAMNYSPSNVFRLHGLALRNVRLPEE